MIFGLLSVFLPRRVFRFGRFMARQGMTLVLRATVSAPASAAPFTVVAVLMAM